MLLLQAIAWQSSAGRPRSHRQTIVDPTGSDASQTKIDVLFASVLAIAMALSETVPPRARSSGEPGVLTVTHGPSLSTLSWVSLYSEVANAAFQAETAVLLATQ
jgi:hypothetical protein